jgi:hypothetical protein
MSLWRGLLLLVAAAGLLAGLLALCPGCAARLGLDFWVLPEFLRGCDQLQQESQQLDAQLHEVCERWDRRKALATAVRAGRLTLWQAAAGFRDLDRMLPPAALAPPLGQVDAGTEEERCCRAVIRQVRWLEADSDPNLPATRRLEAELCERLRHGPLTLPDLTLPAALEGESRDCRPAMGR